MNCYYFAPFAVTKIIDGLNHIIELQDDGLCVFTDKEQIVYADNSSCKYFRLYIKEESYY